jgi:hypothetical protein
VLDHLDEYMPGVEDYRATRGDGRGIATSADIEGLPMDAMVTDNSHADDKTDASAIVAGAPMPRVKRVKTCKVCGRELKPPKKKFCSDECKRAYKRNPGFNDAIKEALKRRKAMIAEAHAQGFDVILGEIGPDNQVHYYVSRSPNPGHCDGCCPAA